MTPAETAALIAQLHPPRLPAEATALAPGDLLAAFGLGLLLAALLAALAGPLLARRPHRETTPERLRHLAGLPPGDRLVEQLRLLADQGTRLPDDVRAALYGRTPPDPARLDALIAKER